MSKMTAMTQPDFDAAAAILRENDRGHYTVPTKGLYPFQWNWDSCLTALGLAALDEDRAFTEIETLFAHQWPDGMVPHIVFHVMDDGYFPGPANLQATLMLMGKGVAKAKDLGQVDMRAIAPTLAKIMGAALPDAEKDAIDLTR